MKAKFELLVKIVEMVDELDGDTDLITPDHLLLVKVPDDIYIRHTPDLDQLVSEFEDATPGGVSVLLLPESFNATTSSDKKLAEMGLQRINK